MGKKNKRRTCDNNSRKKKAIRKTTYSEISVVFLVFNDDHLS